MNWFFNHRFNKGDCFFGLKIKVVIPVARSGASMSRDDRAAAGAPVLNDPFYGHPGVVLRLSDLKRGFKGRYNNLGVYRDGSGGLWQQMVHQGLDSDSILKAIQKLQG